MNAGSGEGLRQLLELVGPDGELPIVADVDPYSLGVKLSSYSADANVPYIMRDIDPALDSALANEFFVCVTGPSAAGKSRTAFEAARRNLPEANLLVPIPKPGVLSQLLDLDSTLFGSKPTVIWLDDLERYLGYGGFDPELLSRVNLQSRTIVLATIRLATLEAIQQAKSGVLADAQQALKNATIIRLSSALTNAEATEARRLYPDQPLERGIGEELVGASPLEQRLNAGQSLNPMGRALVQAAIDWRRAGMLRPILETELRELSSVYLVQFDVEGTPDEVAYAEGLAWALQLVASHASLLARVAEAPPAYYPADYLVTYGHPVAQDLPPQTWDFVLDHADRQELNGVAIAAVLAGNLPIAEKASERRLPQILARVHADLATANDTLGFAPLLRGLRDLLNHRETGLPLTIAITAPWGAGKSSAMLQLQDLLQESRRDSTSARNWYTVVFEAWKYERTERVWAGLAKAIYDQPQGQMPWTKRLSFRFQLEFERHFERQRYGSPKAKYGRRSRETRRIHQWWAWTLFVLKGLVPPLAVLVLIFLAFTRLKGPSFGIAWWLAGLGSAATLIVTTGRSWGIVSDPFKRAIERYTRRPDYADQLGFTAEADKDIRCLTSILTAQEDSALAVFVDDLDRCSPKHVIEVVEAINQIFNSSADSRCVFFLGMDPEVVAASIDVAYSETIDYLKTQDNALASGYGYQFLTKIVQMSLSIPIPNREAMRLLLANLTGNEAPVQESKPMELSEEEIRHFEARIEGRQPVNPADVAIAEQGVRAVGELSGSQQRALEEAARRARAKLFGVDSPDVVGAEFEILGYLSPNPRQIKRFDNAFRLQLHVANSSGVSELSFRRSQLVALGKWIALRLRWPDLAAAIDSEPRLLAALEDNANNVSAETANETMDAEMKVRYGRWFDDPGLKSILEDADPERRIIYLLQLTTPLRVA